MALLWSFLLFAPVVQFARGNLVNGTFIKTSAERLYDKVVAQYNKLILPVEMTDHSVDIRLLLKLVQLNEIDERSQVMTTTVWLRHEWHDAGLVWNPKDFGNITKFHLPADELWLPDTVLYNNADGDYQITIRTKVTIFYTGLVVWLPPAIYKSFCLIDVKYFPFDDQVCELKFGPWSYDVSKVDYWLYDWESGSDQHMTNVLTRAADMSEFSESVEWNVLRVTAKRTVWRYECCPEEYVDITYRISLRRKTLYYTVNLIIPVLLISCLTVFVFYLPAQSGEKITLSISVMVSLVFFMQLLYEMIPPTSLDLPLMSQYLSFTIILVTLSTIATIFTLTVHFRHAHAYDMPKWIRWVFVTKLPKLLFCESPPPKGNDDADCDLNSLFGSDYLPPPSPLQVRQSPVWVSNYENVVFKCCCRKRLKLGPNELKQALRDVRFIADKFKEENEEAAREEDWQAVARVLDRIFLIIFTAAVLVGTASILASAPSLYGTAPSMARH